MQNAAGQSTEHWTSVFKKFVELKLFSLKSNTDRVQEFGITVKVKTNNCVSLYACDDQIRVDRSLTVRKRASQHASSDTVV